MADLSSQNEHDADSKTVDDLSFVVQQEAHRVLSEAQLAPNPALTAVGWERRFVTDSRRVQEMIDLYTEMGYEVHLEPLKREEFDDDCEDCGLVALLKFVTIYTRKKE